MNYFQARATRYTEGFEGVIEHDQDRDMLVGFDQGGGEKCGLVESCKALAGSLGMEEMGRW